MTSSPCNRTHSASHCTGEGVCDISPLGPVTLFGWLSFLMARADSQSPDWAQGGARAKGHLC